jgi:NAD-dependent SIR2 family protein deacetylase
MNSRKFLSNPSEWWNDFWLKTHQTKEFENAQPNSGHFAIATLMKDFPGVRLVTQNIDRLHSKVSHSFHPSIHSVSFALLYYYEC